jgi:hypothetical protein
VISVQIRDFCRDHLKSTDRPVYVPINASQADKANECFFNVQRRVGDLGGELVHGWAIWIWEGVYIEAEHHGIWRSPAGKLADVTPAPAGEKRRLFLADPQATYDFSTMRRRDNVRAALHDDPTIREFFEAAAAWAAFIEAHSHGLRVAFARGEAQPLQKRNLFATRNLYRRFLTDADLCPCGSGRKVRLCCGLVGWTFFSDR